MEELNRAALEAYQGLDLDGAQKHLSRALEAARRDNVDDPLLAEIHVNLGVLAVGGFQDHGKGLEHFRKALEIDPNASVAPNVSTPDIEAIFTLAQGRHSVDERDGSSSNGENAPSLLDSIPHVPVPEQLWSTSVPVFVDTTTRPDIRRMFVHYRAKGMPLFERAEMQQASNGFAFETPCRDSLEPIFEYYITGLNEQGRVVGRSGGEQTPHAVPIVRERSGPAPALPSREPPVQCTDGSSECPPGLPECDGKKNGADDAPGTVCSSDDDCEGNLMCVDRQCVFAERDGVEEEAPKFFVHLGFTYGLGYARSGLAADREPDQSRPPAENVGFVPASDPSCGVSSGSCVVVDPKGFVPTLALRAAFGYWIIPRFSVAGTVRYQINAGNGALSHVLLGVRAQALITKPAKTGFHASGFLGAGYGQIQLQPDQGGATEPFIVSGLNSVDAGGIVGWRFIKEFGLQITPEMHFLFPSKLFVIDLTAGVEIAF